MKRTGVKDQFPYCATMVRERLGLRRNPIAWEAWVKEHPADYSCGPVRRYKTLPFSLPPKWAIIGGNAVTLRVALVRASQVVTRRAIGTRQELLAILSYAVRHWHSFTHGQEIEQAAAQYRAEHFTLETPATGSAARAATEGHAGRVPKARRAVVPDARPAGADAPSPDRQRSAEASPPQGNPLP